MQATTRVFKSGNSQAVRIPADFQLDTQDVTIERDGDALIIRPVKNPWASYFEALDPLQGFPDSIEAAPDNKPDVHFDG